jgi:uracil-DNA glycosylase
MTPVVYPRMKAAGPAHSTVMLIGEAPGAEEIMQGEPFVGSSGKELKRMLRQAGIDPAECYMTNVFWQRPLDNKIENFTNKADVRRALSGMPALMPGRYVDPVFAPELERLYDEIRTVQPNVICALGNTPCWAIFRRTPKITAVRGRVASTTIRGFTYKVLPTYHPAYVLRQWKERVVVLTDFYKLKREARYPDIRLPNRRILIDPTYREAVEFLGGCLHCNEIVLDVETKEGQITVCGIATSPWTAAVIPFWDFRSESYSYWTQENEVNIVKLFRQILGAPHVAKIFQNGLYDLTYFWENWRAPLVNCSEDTMLQAHAMWPELKKDLGTLASIHTDEAAWKMMRFRNRDDFKRED